ncbi:MAG: fatty acid oxidation complex subunit alpha FadB, partial [Enterobacterales bacterium]|nr:fatty acid oxidation complex subunit alpha FadB [Enterobacterales bacterium]
GKHYPAPMKAIDVMEQAAPFERDKALEIEGVAFAKLAKTTVATALIGLFLNDQHLKKLAKQAGKATSEPVAHAAVLGAGIMGGGIAYQSAVRGVPIVMKDIQQDALDLGISTATKILNKGISLGKVTTDKMAKTLGDIKPSLNLDDVKNADIVVEAVVENPAIKDAVLQETEAVLQDDAILASNTSTISIDTLATNLKRPENFCGMHFFNPVHKMKLVEVIRGAKTSEATIAKTVAYAGAMGKSPIVVNDCPGFLVNRILFPYFRGFSLLMRDGADFVTTDKVMQGFGWPMGPAYLLDVVGLDTSHHAAAVLAEGYPDRMSALDNDVVSALYEAGHMGQKSGSGFYAYGKDKKGKPTKTPADAAYTTIKSLAEPKDFEAQTIIERMMLPMLIESIRCFEDGIVASAAELDMGLIYGIGFPPFLGGALRYADQIGMKNLCLMAEKYKALGASYEPTPGMLAMAENNERFY